MTSCVKLILEMRSEVNVWVVGDDSFSFNRARSIPTYMTRPKSALNGDIPRGIAIDAL